MHFSSSFVWVWLAAMIGIFYFGEGINSNPVHHVSRVVDNGPYVPGQKFSRTTGIPNEATEEEASDRDYFAFTEANKQASRLDEWYHNWLKSVNASLVDLLPGEERPSEWQRFAADFWSDRDFLCGPLNQGSCDNMPSRREIMAMYPNNRTEARLVYYVTQIYQNLHHYNVQYQITIKEILQLILGWIKDIITSATFQQEMSATEKCNFITAISKAFISAAIQLIGPITGGMLAPLQAAGGILEELAPIIKLGASLNSEGTTADFNSLTMGISMAVGIGDIMIGNLISKDPLAAGGQPGFWNPASQNFLATGVSTNPFCQTFSGDYPDLNLENEQGMMKLITRLLDEAVTESRVAFHTMYHGNFSTPSLTLQATKAQNWDNIRERIDAAIDSRKASIEESIFLYALGEAASQDHTFMACNLVPEGERCQETDDGNDYSNTVICPLPERFSGRLQCSVGHLHEWTNNYSVEKTPLLRGLADLRVNTRFNYTIRELGMMAFNNYLKNGNRPSTLGLTEFGTLATGFHLPVCLFPQGKLLDFTNQKRGYNRNFLGICGDFTGDETEDFFDKMNLGIGSPHRNIVFREEMIPATFSLNRPRLSPVTWLTGLCRLGYAWPASARLESYHDGYYIQDIPWGRCWHLLNQISMNNYTMEEANNWLCTTEKELPWSDRHTDWRVWAIPDVPLYFRFKKQSERSITEKCRDWRVDGTRDFEWSRDLGDLVPDSKELKAIETENKALESQERFEKTVQLANWMKSHPRLGHGPVPDAPGLPGLPQLEARRQKMKFRNKVDLPTSLMAEAADVCGLKDLDSGKASIEGLQECVKKRVSSWHKGV